MRVGVVDLTPSHRFILQSTCELLEEVVSDVVVFTDETVRDQLVDRGYEPDRHEVVLQDDDESDRRFLSRVDRRSSGDLDAVIVNTVGFTLREYCAYAGFDPDCPVYFRVYAVRSWLNQSFEARDIASLFRVNVGHLLRRWLLSRADGVLVEYPAMKWYVREHTEYGGDVVVVPIQYDVDRYTPDIETDGTRLVVPGNVQSFRRDYDGLLDALSAGTDPGDDIELELLGRPRDEYGEQILDRCRGLRRDGYTVEFHTDWITDRTFERRLAAADVLCAPLRPETEEPVFNRETYGSTKGTAAITHSLNHGLPLVVPERFDRCWDMDSYCFEYTTVDDLVDLFGRLGDGDVDTETRQRRAAATGTAVRTETRERVTALLKTAVNGS